MIRQCHIDNTYAIMDRMSKELKELINARECCGISHPSDHACNGCPLYIVGCVSESLHSSAKDEDGMFEIEQTQYFVKKILGLNI